jgi:hypothetical protein
MYKIDNDVDDDQRKGQQKVNRRGERVRLGLLCLLLLIMLGILAFATVNTIRATQTLQKQIKAVKTGDVSAIHPWMTIHVIAHIYNVPEDYLYSSLNLQDTPTLHHATLYEIAGRKKQPVNQIIHTLQQAIASYRRTHPRSPTPTPTPRARRVPPAPGRIQI